MKPAAVEVLVCPGCKGTLRLSMTRRDGAEVLEGTLACRTCGAEYPVTRGVPRFVAHGAYAASFGFQWNLFRTVQVDSLNGTQESERALAAATGWTDGDYRGRRVLDAGVGAGRFAEIVARKGGEVFGIDLTTAVEAAYLNIGHHERVHLAQADIFAMPFRDETFDLAYSIGVLHHTPDPQAAFACVGGAVKPGGGLAVYVYARYGPGHYIVDALRAVTSRLPAGLMVVLSATAIPLYYLYRLPAVGKVLGLLCPISVHPNWRVRWLDTYDWYTPRYQAKFLYPEVFRWFRGQGFHEIEIFDGPIRMRGVKAAEPRVPQAGVSQPAELAQPREDSPTAGTWR